MNTQEHNLGKSLVSGLAGAVALTVPAQGFLWISRDAQAGLVKVAQVHLGASVAGVGCARIPECGRLVGQQLAGLRVGRADGARHVFVPDQVDEGEAGGLVIGQERGVDRVRHDALPVEAW